MSSSTDPSELGSDSAGVEPGPNRPARLRVLVVDDNEPIRVLLCTYLEHWGAEVQVASNGAQALDLLADDLPDVILMDLRMPVLSGTEATREIRRRWPSEGAPRIIGITGEAPSLVFANFSAAGGDEILAKPLDMPRLRQMLGL